MTRCPQCSAESLGTDGCRKAFEELLAFEWIDRDAFGAVHHLTVAAYSLQHPTGYARRGLELCREMLANGLDGHVNAADLRARISEEFEGSKKVRDPLQAVPLNWPTDWPRTVRDAVPGHAEIQSTIGHILRVRSWADSVRRTLDRALA
jgi:hypothetical protein